MHNLVLSPPKFGFVVGTRAALALGVGLLVSRKLSNSRRLAIGKTLIALGALTTIPAALVLRHSHEHAS